MKTEKLNHWFTLAANVGILLGLLLVGVQIMETNRIANAQFVADDRAVTMSSYDLIIGEKLSEAWAKARTNSGDLTDEDIVVLDAFLTREWFKSLREREIADTGVKEYDIESETTLWVFTFLANEFALQWWENHNGLLNTYRELKDSVNGSLAQMPDSQSQIHRIQIEQYKNK